MGSERPIIYRAGDSFYEEPGAHHTISENASESQPANLLAVFIVDAEDRPLTLPDPPTKDSSTSPSDLSGAAGASRAGRMTN